MTKAPLQIFAAATAAMLGTALLAGPGCVITEPDGETGGGGSAATTGGGGTTGEGGSVGGGGIGGAGGAIATGGAGGQGGSSSTGVPLTCGSSECAVGSELCCWDDNDMGTCVAGSESCDWFPYECTSPTHCAGQGLCCVLPGLDSICLPAITGDCGTFSTACDTVADCPDLDGTPAIDCVPSSDGGPAHDICTW